MASVINNIFDKKWKKVNEFSEIKTGDELCHYKFPYYRWQIVLKILPQSKQFEGIGYNLEKWGKRLVRKTFNFEDFKFERAHYHGPVLSSEDTIKHALSYENKDEYSILTNYARAFTRWCKTGRKGIFDRFHDSPNVACIQNAIEVGFQLFVVVVFFFV